VGELLSRTERDLDMLFEAFAKDARVGCSGEVWCASHGSANGLEIRAHHVVDESVHATPLELGPFPQAGRQVVVEAHHHRDSQDEIPFSNRVSVILTLL
jgi:hypothetical protein